MTTEIKNINVIETKIQSKKSDKLIPSLRFSEFVGEWEKKEIGETCLVKTGGRDTQDKINDGQYPFFVRSNTVERINSYSFDGEAILTSGDGVGVGKNFHYINEKFDYHQRVYALHTFKEDYSGKFIYQVFVEKFYKRVMRLSAKNSVDSVRMGMITEMKIGFPKLEEQEKIAKFLTSVDTKIQQLTRKKETLNQYKKGVMQQLFSQQIRFKKNDGTDFPGWQEKKLGELTYKVGKKNKKNIQYPIYSINNKEGFLPQSQQFDGLDSNVRGYDITLYKIVESETFAYNPARINVGSIGYSYDLVKVIVSSLYICFKTKEELDDLYLLAYLDTYSFQKDILRYEEGGVRQYLFYENFSMIKVPFPSIKEQEKIATYLSAIDMKIAKVETQISQTALFKKGLLQQLFV
ncbi:restriction endonuclease subunit S [Tenacibaculum piscium]|uniref:restriction endonuclease subunit S n=1 Tax=Tenacibaculum piscium TaxID=1458515 RepID=UPI00187B6175|nr:restriction endonuclease subunit S [Tenacibaculum piscium]MBE7684592.1 restriction endonuclease subunit S [Tenacibaculum piscium]